MKTTIKNATLVAAFTVGYGALLAYAIPRYLVKRRVKTWNGEWA